MTVLSSAFGCWADIRVVCCANDMFALNRACTASGEDLEALDLLGGRCCNKLANVITGVICVSAGWKKPCDGFMRSSLIPGGIAAGLLWNPTAAKPVSGLW